MPSGFFSNMNLYQIYLSSLSLERKKFLKQHLKVTLSKKKNFTKIVLSAVNENVKICAE